MRVCYLIQSHKNPEQIYRLVNTIKKTSPESIIIVSHDFSSSQLDEKQLNHLPEVYLVSGLGGRGNFSIIEGYLNAIDWLFKNKIEFDWLTNLSGQDYPTQHLSEINNFLSNTYYEGFLEYFKVFSTESHWSLREGYTRYLYKYHKIKFIAQLPDRVKDWLAPIKIINYVQPFLRINIAFGMIGLKRKPIFKENLVCYGGSFFCTLSKKCIEYLYNFSKSNRNIIDYYQEVNVPEESFLQTVLINSHLFKLCNDNKFYIDFTGTRNGRPRLLSTEDYASIVKSDTYFARKFDLDKDRQILDLLDNRILSVNS
ncbi:beta-1,6-N-acetylglucosaminyltransferase [Scytonema sp. NUACC26]|uniref:beta-1,6-N-acetylglucosaminyltransferase n=1 Tax=Scytonema sp. NUACC26 TaxID=3140176 RepID=UPI0034DBD2E9